MDLILQGLQPEPTTVERIATLAGARHVTAISPQAFRCEQVDSTPSVKEQVAAACLAVEMDCTWLAGKPRLSDFKLLAMDMDSTLITIECIDEIADMQGLKPEVAAITEAAMRGEIEFPESLARRVALLKGLDATALQRVYQERVQLSPGAQTMLDAVRRAGIKTLLVSGGFTFFTDRIKEHLHLDYSHANVLEIADGKLTGKVIGTVVDAGEKKRTVERICAEIGILLGETIVMGDGANDLQMMSIAGMSVAFRAKPLVRTQADVALNFVGLDGILPLFK